jgi:hypothetical protein
MNKHPNDMTAEEFMALPDGPIQIIDEPYNPAVHGKKSPGIKWVRRFVRKPVHVRVLSEDDPLCYTVGGSTYWIGQYEDGTFYKELML